MAAIAIPLAIELAPFAFTAVAKLMDRLFGDKTGPTKFTVGTQILTAVMPQLQKLVGKSVALPGAAEIPALLQSAVDELNAKGALQGPKTALDPATSGRVPVAGVVMMLRGLSMVLEQK